MVRILFLVVHLLTMIKNVGNKEANDQEDDNEGDANYDPEAEVVITLPEGTFR